MDKNAPNENWNAKNIIADMVYTTGSKFKTYNILWITILEQALS